MEDIQRSTVRITPFHAWAVTVTRHSHNNSWPTSEPVSFHRVVFRDGYATRSFRAVPDDFGTLVMVPYGPAMCGHAQSWPAPRGAA